MKREIEIDAARGLMLVWMTLTHLPTALTPWVNQPFGYFSASEGFIFLSALFTGRIYYRLLTRDGLQAMTRKLLLRTLRLYGYHVLLLFLGFGIAAHLLSLGLPMLLMGDEVRRTQLGNNNSYCQDNETNWFDWSLLAKHADVHRFVRLLTARRLLRDTEAERQRMTLTQLISKGIRGWHGVKLNEPDWNKQSHSIAFSAELPKQGLLAYFIFK